MQVLPRVQAAMRGWAPLREPGRGLRELRAWRPLLESPAQRDAIFQEVLLLPVLGRDTLDFATRQG